MGLNFFFFEKASSGGNSGVFFEFFVFNMTVMTLMTPTPKTYPYGYSKIHSLLLVITTAHTFLFC